LNFKILIILCCIVLFSDTSSAGVIDPQSYRALTSDRKALQIGDILTVLVDETTLATASTDTGLNSDTNLDFSGKAGINQGALAFDLNAGSQNDGKTSRKGQTHTVLSARVVDRLRNGNLKIEGLHQLTINKDKQTIHVTGYVRPDDVGYDNTVLSYRIYNATIQIVGQGVLDKSQQPSIIYRVLKWMQII
jgi:flagellar L-ring protein precursor FlgH